MGRMKTTLDLKHAVERQEERLGRHDMDIRALTNKVNKDIEKSEHWIKAWIDKIDEDRKEWIVRLDKDRMESEARLSKRFEKQDRLIQWLIAIGVTAVFGVATILITLLR